MNLRLQIYSQKFLQCSKLHTVLAWIWLLMNSSLDHQILIYQHYIMHLKDLLLKLLLDLHGANIKSADT